ncbi:hypothetical protein CCR97_08165 [Rhodoplanes elegans]|uniref:Helicase ATP-binding domain-containing protein n=1 Tax=Rhodoplanes elegans TaxID=29408 RepID=A0A327L2Q1_9BRAD|nr:DEAD/DEAH box helicase [Rhodoplanes elegans]MBK5958093.1 hypothetical protein [Rhodoplanes elegans]MBK5958185.1 hypothetical protein [Rhodoplanes elegans]RAI41968.1 hypothetical protein CH338_01305 [Rhodoplanes elegans]
MTPQSRDPLHREIAALREQVEGLQAGIDRLRQINAVDPFEPPIPWAQTQAAIDRRYMRLLIKRAKLSRAYRDVLQTIVNLWFRNRSNGGVIHPGRSKIAKMARVSVPTVTRALSEFRERSFIKATAYQDGGARVTRYLVDLNAIRDALTPPHLIPVTVPGTLGKIVDLRERDLPKEYDEPIGYDAWLADTDYHCNPDQNDPRIIDSPRDEFDQRSPEPIGTEGPGQEETGQDVRLPGSNVIPFRPWSSIFWLGSSSMLTASSPRQLRPHQQSAIDMLRDSLRAGNKRVILQAPTGFGKTITAVKIIGASLAKGHRVLFTVPRLSLVNQAIADFERDGLSHVGAMQSDHPRTDDSAPVQVATVQTLKRRLRNGNMDENFGLVIVDECHEDFTVIREMMARWPTRVFVGLSATPWTIGLGRHWQDLRIAATIGSLIEAGYLSKFVAFAPDKPDLSKVRTVAGDYAENDLEQVMSENKLVGHVVQTWLEKGGNRPTLVFGVNCSHAKVLQEQFLRAGVSAGYCDAHTDIVAREHLKRQFISGEIKVVCSVRTLTTGVDWPVSCIVDAAPTKSEMLHVQRIGRGLRINPGTEDLVILDHAGNSLRLGLVTDIHHAVLDKGEGGKAKARRKAEKLPRECSACGALHTGRVCPECGHESRRPCEVETVDGRLVEITGRAKAPTQAEKQRFWSMALDMDDHRKRGGKLALGLYKSKFGVWPRGLLDVRIPFDGAFQRYEQSRRIRWAKKMESERRAVGGVR